MARPAPRRRGIRGPLAASGGRQRGRPGHSRLAPVPVEPPPGAPAAAQPADDVYVQGVIEFLDKRWTRAEADLRTALRSLLLLFGTTIGCALLVTSLAAAAVGAAFLLMFAQDRFLGAGPGASGLALLGAAGLGLLLLLLRERRSGYLRRRRSRDR